MNPGIIALMIPILALMIPIVALLVTHQQKMAEIIHRNAKSNTSDAEIAALREDIRSLRDALNEQSLAIEAVRDLQGTNLQERVRNNA